MNATIELASKVFEHCRPSAAKPFLLFSLHDLYKMMAGLHNFTKDSVNTSLAILQQSCTDNPSTKNEKPAAQMALKTLMARLWCHEGCRVFRDRLQTNEEGNTFTTFLIFYSTTFSYLLSLNQNYCKVHSMIGLFPMKT